MRRGRRGTEDSIDNTIDEKPEPEFARVKLKKAGNGTNSRSVDDISNEATSELRKKLEKQKSVADGLIGTCFHYFTSFLMQVISFLKSYSRFVKSPSVQKKRISIENCFQRRGISFLLSSQGMGASALRAKRSR